MREIQRPIQIQISLKALRAFTVWPIPYTSANLQEKGGIKAHFLQKYERYTGKNTSADSQIFNFSQMARIAFLTMSKRFRTVFEHSRTTLKKGF